MAARALAIVTLILFGYSLLKTSGITANAEPAKTTRAQVLDAVVDDDAQALHRAWNSASRYDPWPTAIAAAFGHHEMLAELIALHADVNARSGSGHTPLMSAALMGDEVAVSQLLAAGADPGAVDDYGDTALTLAKAGGYEKVVMRLSGRHVEPSALPAVTLSSY